MSENKSINAIDANIDTSMPNNFNTAAFSTPKLQTKIEASVSSIGNLKDPSLRSILLELNSRLQNVEITLNELQTSFQQTQYALLELMHEAEQTDSALNTHYNMLHSLETSLDKLQEMMSRYASKADVGEITQWKPEDEVPPHY